MRLDPDQIRVIEQTAETAVGDDARVILFGSRVGDARKGGDIDLLFETAHRVCNYVATVEAAYVSLICRLCNQKIDLPLKVAATPTAPVLTIARQTGIVNLDLFTGRIAGFTLGHSLHRFVVYRPSSRMFHPRAALKQKGRQACLDLTYRVGCQKPIRQRQLYRWKDGSFDQRGQIPKGIALKYRVRTSTHDAVCNTAAVKMTKTIRPTSSLENIRAMRLASKGLNHLRQRQAELKLDAIHCYDAALEMNGGGRVRTRMLTT